MAVKIAQLAAAVLVAALPQVAGAQVSAAGNATVVHTARDLRNDEADLIAKAAASSGGEAGLVLHRFDSHWAFLMARMRTGEAEVHEL